MTALTDAEVERRFAAQLAPLTTTRARPVFHPYWLWQWLKACTGWLQDSGIAKVAVAFVSVAYFVMLCALVVIGSAVADRLWLTCVYVLAMVVLVPLAMCEGRP